MAATQRVSPIGCLLMLVFSALTPYRVMSLISEMMQPDPVVSDVTSLAPIGTCGAVMFGLGMIALTLLRRKPSLIGRKMLDCTPGSLGLGSFQWNGKEWS